MDKRTETVNGSDVWVVEFAYDNRNRLTRETRTKTSTEPDVVEYDIAYEYDQLGNRTVRTDHVCGPAAAGCVRETFYHYDVDVDPNQLTYATHHNRLLSYEVYDTSDPNAAALLRTVRYTYYDTGQASNITVFDEQQTPDPNSHVWHHDVALHYYTHGPLKLAVWGKWQEDENGPIDATYQVIKAREFRYDSARGRYLAADIATPQNDSQYWTLDGDPVWTDYEGDTPYADSTMNASTYAATQVNRFFGLAGEKDATTGAESYRQGDLIGSTMATTDATGSIGVPPVSYTAFGELLDSNGAPGGAAPSGMPRYQYAGEWGYESGLITLSGADPDLPPITLQHLGARWYQPDIGRFVQRDPIGIRAGLNVYLYCDGNPGNCVDPTGLTSIDPWILREFREACQRIGENLAELRRAIKINNPIATRLLQKQIRWDQAFRNAMGRLSGPLALACVIHALHSAAAEAGEEWNDDAHAGARENVGIGLRGHMGGFGQAESEGLWGY